MSSSRLELYVENLDCENDAAKLRRGLASTPGVLETTVFPKGPPRLS